MTRDTDADAARAVSADGEMAPENELEEAMLAASRGQRDQASFLAALGGAELLLPKAQGVDTGSLPGPSETLELPLFERDGRHYVPAFTSLRQLRLALPGGGGYYALPARALAESWAPEHWLAINPGGELGLPLSPREVAALSSRPGVEPVPLGLGTKVVLGDPAQEPTLLLQALSELARRHPQVEAAYRYLGSPRLAARPRELGGR